MSQNLEDSAEEGSVEFEQLRVINHHLNKVFTSILSIVKPNQEPEEEIVETDAKEVITIFQELKQFIEQSEPEEVTAALKKIKRVYAGDDLQTLEDMIAGYEYDNAVALIDNIIKKI